MAAVQRGKDAPFRRAQTVGLECRGELAVTAIENLGDPEEEVLFQDEVWRCRHLICRERQGLAVQSRLPASWHVDLLDLKPRWRCAPILSVVMCNRKQHARNLSKNSSRFRSICLMDYLRSHAIAFSESFSTNCIA